VLLVRKGDSRSLTLFKAAAAEGVEIAQHNVAAFLRAGSESARPALDATRLAAEMGVPKAWNNMGVLLNDMGMLKEAARRGVPMAAFNMGVMSEEERDILWVWAARAGDPYALSNAAVAAWVQGNNAGLEWMEKSIELGCSDALAN
jgi:TPR repeat protein